VRLWLERYLLPICASVVISVIVLNPLKLDWRQRISLVIATSALAYFVGHTLHRTSIVVPDPSLETKAALESQQRQITELKEHLARRHAEDAEEAQKKKTIKNRLAQFLNEAMSIQHGIEYNDPNAIREKDAWEKRVEEYLRKDLDESYAVRFRNPSHQVSSYPLGINPQMLVPWGQITARMAMLNDFMSELRD
jgi:hypothetical protein